MARRIDHPKKDMQSQHKKLVQNGEMDCLTHFSLNSVCSRFSFRRKHRRVPASIICSPSLCLFRPTKKYQLPNHKVLHGASTAALAMFVSSFGSAIVFSSTWCDVRHCFFFLSWSARVATRAAVRFYRWLASCCRCCCCRWGCLDANRTKAPLSAAAPG